MRTADGATGNRSPAGRLTTPRHHLPVLAGAGALLLALLTPTAGHAAHSGEMADARSDVMVARERMQAQATFNPERIAAEAERERQAVRAAMSQPPAEFAHYQTAVAAKRTVMSVAAAKTPADRVSVPLGVTDLSISGNLLQRVATAAFDVMIFGSMIAVLCTYFWRQRKRRAAAPRPA